MMRQITGEDLRRAAVQHLDPQCQDPRPATRQRRRRDAIYPRPVGPTPFAFKPGNRKILA